MTPLCAAPLRVVDESQDWRRKTLRCDHDQGHDGWHSAGWEGNEARWDGDTAELILRCGDWSIDNEPAEVSRG